MRGTKKEEEEKKKKKSGRGQVFIPWRFWGDNPKGKARGAARDYLKGKAPPS
jgi:hypothetical protein